MAGLDRRRGDSAQRKGHLAAIKVGGHPYNARHFSRPGNSTKPQSPHHCPAFREGFFAST